VRHARSRYDIHGRFGARRYASASADSRGPVVDSALIAGHAGTARRGRGSARESAGQRGSCVAPPNHPARGLRPDRPAAYVVRTPDPPHPARPDHQRDPLAGGARAHRAPDQLDGPHLQPRRHRPRPDRGPAPHSARAGLVHQPGQPAHPRPQRGRPFHDRGARRRTVTGATALKAPGSDDRRARHRLSSQLASGARRVRVSGGILRA